MPEFFKGIFDSLYTWFVVERGWATALGIVLTVVLGYVIVKIIMGIAKRLVNKTRMKGLAGNFLLTILKVVLMFIYLMAVMSVLGIDTSGVMAVLAASSLALSLALQSTLSNFSSGLILVSNKPFEEGDFVEVAGVSGVVDKITLSSTKIKTGDNKIITLPNATVAGGSIINYSTATKRRVDLTFGVGYGSDIERVKAIITEELEKHELILHDEGYTVRLLEQGASSLNFVCRCWTKRDDYWAVYFDLNEAMTKRFTDEGIEIPFNKLDVNIIGGNK